MTRKDYVLIANAIATAKLNADREERPIISRAASHIAYALRRENSRFDTSRFMAACGFSATD